MDLATATAAAAHTQAVVTNVDYVVIGMILVSMALGFWTGFVWQFVRIAGLVASVWISWLYYPTVAQFLPASIPLSLRHVLGAAAVFVAVLMLCYLVAFLFHDVIDALKPEMPDRLLGAMFGLIKGVMLVGFIAFMMMRFLPTGNDIRRRVADSRGAVAAASCARAVLSVLPVHLSSGTQGDQARQGEAGPPRG